LFFPWATFFLHGGLVDFLGFLFRHFFVLIAKRRSLTAKHMEDNHHHHRDILRARREINFQLRDYRSVVGWSFTRRGVLVRATSFDRRIPTLLHLTNPPRRVSVTAFVMEHAPDLPKPRRVSIHSESRLARHL
jgi:hypothetical protein